MQGNAERARELYVDGRAAIREVAGEGWHAAWTSLSASRVEMLARDFVAAERELRYGEAILDRIGEQYLLSTITALLARALCAQGRFDEASALSTRAEELAGDDDIETQAEWRAARATVMTELGRIDDAKTLAQDALQLLLPTDSAVMKVETLIDLGKVYARIGDSAAAWAFGEALTHAQRKGDIVTIAEATELLGAAGFQSAEQQSIRSA